jgi:hypothetical protein
MDDFYQFTEFFQPHSALGFCQPMAEMITGEKNENVSG